ncbi:hypothetical protein [Ferruginibacter albus]|uniref:hypothetical protein n=1 Tax=Ferruginibacter albus TaxID=2875540 RepID=UPI001CC65683|nr:hypothetical protein [Ferruginibacter albus]UAY52104.1 hypothetical protein K9M53_00065 [Ferruginibacter albus]
MRLIGLALTLLICTCAFSQDNSPYSRYGLGDIAPNRSIALRSMGGIAAGYTNFQSLNSVNPASYGSIYNTIYDVSAEADVNSLKDPRTLTTYSSTNLLFSYMQLGFPIAMKKANKKGIALGATFGLKPETRINYDISSDERLQGIDSIHTNYLGSGGLTKAYAGLGLRIKEFSIGFNVGYMFGNKNYNTQLSFLNDSVTYQSSNSGSNTSYGGVYVDGGIMYQKDFTTLEEKKKGIISALTLGAYGSLKRNLSATEDLLRETIYYNTTTGAYTHFDSVYEKTTNGKITYPATFGFGASYQNTHWTFGADYEATHWTDYTYFGQKDSLQNSWLIRAGAEYIPADITTTTNKSYFNFVRYRAGFYYGEDYIKITGNMPVYAFTFGAALPLQLRKSSFNTQTSILNLAFEIGSRGNDNSTLRQTTFRICFGLSLGDLWFRRAKYY